MQETQVQSLGQEDPLEEGVATHSGILTWEIPWTEEPGGLQSTGPREAYVTHRLNNKAYSQVKTSRLSTRATLCVCVVCMHLHTDAQKHGDSPLDSAHYVFPLHKDFIFFLSFWFFDQIYKAENKTSCLLGNNFF